MIDVTLFYVAFAFYFAGFIAYTLYIPFRSKTFAQIATVAMAVGLLPQTAAIGIRWATCDHVPLSNMYEYMSLMSWMAVVSLLILIWRYKRPLVGSFISPLVFMLMVTASLLPKDPTQQLMPALQSYWLTIHVSLAALGSGTFVVACAVSFIYLMKVHKRQESGTAPASGMLFWFGGFFAFPLIFYVILYALKFHPNTEMVLLLGGKEYANIGTFIIALGMALPLAGIILPVLYNTILKSILKDKSNFGSYLFALTALALLIAALLAGLANTFGLFHISSPMDLNGNGRIDLGEARPLRIFEFFGIIAILLVPVFLLLYIFLYSFKGNFLEKMDVNLDLLDEINYKAITLGYPLYIVGALFAGAIWAEQAWGQFWSWDPKEVGALIIALFYTAFLHARYLFKWKGSKAAILAVFGFLMVLLSFFGNYFFGGNHAYA